MNIYSKIYKNQQKIIELEEKLNSLKRFIRHNTQPHKIASISNKHKTILDSMSFDKFVKLKEILFNSNNERTKCKHIDTLIFYNFVISRNSGRWKEYAKIKDYNEFDKL